MNPSLRIAFVTLLFLSFAATSARAQDSGVAIGDPAPRIEAPTADGDVWTSDQAEGKYLIVYFYPAAMTGGCTAQACAFRDDRTKLLDMGAEVVGISGDNVDGLKVFKKAHNLNFPLLSDANGDIARAFGVPVGDGGKIRREVDGQEVELVREVSTARWTFIVSPDGKVVYRDTQVDAAGDSKNVIAALQRLKEAEG